MSLAGHSVVLIGAQNAVQTLEKGYRDAGAQITCGVVDGSAGGSEAVDISSYKSVAAIFASAAKQNGAVDIIVACLPQSSGAKAISSGLPPLEEEIRLIEAVPRLAGWIWRIGEHYLSMPNVGRKPVRAKQLLFVIDNPAPSPHLSPAHASAADAVLGIAKSVNVAATFYGYSVITVCLDPSTTLSDNSAAATEILRLSSNAEPPTIETNGAYVVQQPGGSFKTIPAGNVGIRESIGVQLFGARLGAAIFFRIKTQQAIARTTLALRSLDTPGGPRGVLAALASVLAGWLWRRGMCPGWLALLAGWLVMTCVVPPLKVTKAQAGSRR